MGKKSETADVVQPTWYEVTEQSYIGDRLYQAGDRVQFDGEAGANLRELTAEELKTPEPAKTDADLIADQQDAIEQAKADLDKRESDLAAREKDADAKVQEAAAQADANDARAKELDAREAAVAEKEKAVADATAKTKPAAE